MAIIGLARSEECFYPTVYQGFLLEQFLISRCEPDCHLLWNYPQNPCQGEEYVKSRIVYTGENVVVTCCIAFCLCPDGPFGV